MSGMVAIIREVRLPLPLPALPWGPTCYTIRFPTNIVVIRSLANFAPAGEGTLGLQMHGSVGFEEDLLLPNTVAARFLDGGWLEVPDCAELGNLSETGFTLEAWVCPDGVECSRIMCKAT